MNKISTIAVGTAAGILLAIGAVALFVVGTRKVHEHNEGKISDTFKQKMGVAIKTYEKVVDMDEHDPQFKPTLSQLHMQELDATPETEHEQSKWTDFSELYTHQVLRQSSAYNAICKPVVPKGRADTCDRLGKEQQARIDGDKATLARLKEQLSW